MQKQVQKYLTKMRTKPQYLQAKEKRKENTQIKDTRMKAVLCEYQNRYKKKKINRHFDVNSRKRGGGMASPWKISLFSAWWKKFLVSSRSIHRWNADKRADEPVRALIVESGNSSRREKRSLQTFICKNKCLRPVLNTLSTKFYFRV